MTERVAVVAALGTVLLAAAAMGTAARRPQSPLGCALTIEGSPYTGGPVVLRFTLTNHGERAVWVLRWATPLEEGWLGTPFALIGPGGGEIPFRGPRLKRGDPGREDYIELPPHREVTATVDLAAAYGLAQPGGYELRTVGGLHDVTTEGRALPRPRAQFAAAPLECAPLRFRLRAR